MGPSLVVRRESAVTILVLAMWFGLVASALELALLAGRKFVLHRMLYLSPHVVWMAPLMNVLCLVIAACCLIGIAQRWPRVGSLRVAALAFAGIGLLGPLFMYGPLHPAAAVLLAAGVATQAARLIAARADGFRALVRRTTGWMLVLVVGAAVGIYGWQALRERRALATLPPAPPDAPNVLLISLDTVRAANLSLYGYARATTPQLERFAQIGVRFERALSTAPWTLPSHAGMFTGRFPSELSTDWRTSMDTTYPTLAEVFRAHGYVTAGFVANLLYCAFETGLGRGFVHYEDYHVSAGELMENASLACTVGNLGWTRRIIRFHDLFARKSAADVNRELLHWLSVRSERRPFFAFLNYFDAHDPYLPPPPFNVRFGPDRPERYLLVEHFHRVGTRLVKACVSASGIESEMAAYDGAIAYMDDQLGRLFDELGKRGLLRNTVVIVTSDHGEQFGEHGFFEHGNSLYWPLLHVPLVISFPERVPVGGIVHESVSLSDLAATVMDLAGMPNEARIPGDSLARYWRGAAGREDPSREVRLSEFKPRSPRGALTSVVSAGRHYIRYADGREELFDLERDPAEEHDLAQSDDGRHALEEVRSALEELKRSRPSLSGAATVSVTSARTR